MRKRNVILLGLMVCSIFVFTTASFAVTQGTGGQNGAGQSGSDANQGLLDPSGGTGGQDDDPLGIGEGPSGMGDQGGMGDPGGMGDDPLGIGGQGGDPSGMGNQDGAGGPDSGNGVEPEGDTLDLFDVKGIKGGLIQVAQNIFYASDTLDVAVIIPQSMTEVWDGTAEVYVVIRLSDGTLLDPIQISVSEQVPDEPKNLVTLDLSDTPLTEGEYQIALIVVKAGGDALSMGDWFNGFKGMVGATKFEIKKQCDSSDADSDCDGLLDDTSLSVDYATVTVGAGLTTTVVISNGTSPYTAVSSDDTVAAVSVSGDVATIEGVAQGTATITITDDSGNTVDVAVTVEAASLSY